MVETVVLFALVAIAGVIFHSALMFRATLAATAQVRADYLDVVLSQQKSFEATLQMIRDSQSVGGTPMQLAVAQHEGQVELTKQAADQNYELAKLDAEMRRGMNGPRKPTVVPASVAHGG